jgi:hypothetical protein
MDTPESKPVDKRLLALPDKLKPILGEMGQKIGGPNVKGGRLGPYFEIKKSFEVR